MANYLILNQNYVQDGLGTLTFNTPADGIYNVQAQVTVPAADATGAGAGSAADQGLGALGGLQGIGQGSNLSLGNGGKGLGFGGTILDNASGNGSGHGAGAGGGTLAEFSRGGGGLGAGSVGQGFGADASGYNQPPTDVIVPTSGAAISSSLSIVVNVNGSPVYTAPALAGEQAALQFRTELVLEADDVVTIVLSSANAADNQLNSLKSNISIGQGA